MWIFWTIACTLIALVWASRHRDLNKARRTVRALTPASYDGAPASPPRVSVCVAAKDEQDNIEACVRSFLTQDYPDFQVIIANDRSTDRTGEILRRLEAEGDARLRVVTVRELRAGWFGKNNAMREAVAAADGHYLCFADADCRQTSHRTLSVAMHEIRDGGVDFLSVLPVLETRSVWERIIQPVCAAVMLLWFHPDRVNNPRSKAAYANGAFMLMSRRAYERIGGHETVRQQVNEDTHMARLAKSAGLKLRVIQNEGLYVTRMYSTFGQAWRGWSRIFYGCFGSVQRVAVSLLVLLLLSISPWATLLTCVVILPGRPDAGWADPVRLLALLAGAACFFMLTVMLRFYRLVRIPPAYALTYPFGAVLCAGMLTSALLKASGATGTTWRGTTYRRQPQLPNGSMAARSPVTAPGPSPIAAGSAIHTDAQPS